MPARTQLIPLYLRLPNVETRTSKGRASAFADQIRESRSSLTVASMSDLEADALLAELHAHDGKLLYVDVRNRLSPELVLMDLARAMTDDAENTLAAAPTLSLGSLLARAIDLADAGEWWIVLDGIEVAFSKTVDAIADALRRYLRRARVLLISREETSRMETSELDLAIHTRDEIIAALACLDEPIPKHWLVELVGPIAVEVVPEPWLVERQEALLVEPIRVLMNETRPLESHHIDAHIARLEAWVSRHRGDPERTALARTWAARLGRALRERRPLEAPRCLANLERRTISVDNREIDLSGRETLWRIVVALIESRDQGALFADKEWLFTTVWGESEYHPLKHDNRLRLAVRRLRQLVEDKPSDPVIVRTVGDGYTLQRLSHDSDPA